MAVNVRPKYTMQKNLNISFAIITFVILGLCEIDFQSLAQNRMSNNSLKSVRYGLKKLRGFESVLSQSSLGNAMEICSAIENDLILARRDQ